MFGRGKPIGDTLIRVDVARWYGYDALRRMLERRYGKHNVHTTAYGFNVYVTTDDIRQARGAVADYIMDCAVDGMAGLTVR